MARWKSARRRRSRGEERNQFLRKGHESDHVVVYLLVLRKTSTGSTIKIASIRTAYQKDCATLEIKL